MEILEFIINGSATKRFHTWPVLKEQRVDSHSHNVALLCALMAQDDTDGEGLGVPLLMAALTHDLPEWKMGDLPAPAKRAMPDVMTTEGEVSFRKVWGMAEMKLLEGVGLEWESLLSEKEQRWLKLADAMEGALYCIRERMMGNRYINVCYDNFVSYIVEIVRSDHTEEPMVMEILGYIYDSWEQANER